MKEVFYVVFEGNSERGYIEKLNRFLEENDIPCYFKAPSELSLNGVISLKSIIKGYRGAKLKAKKEKIIIWIDNDLFERGKLNKEELRKKVNDSSVLFYFIYQNFEDFFAMHLENSEFLEHYNDCNAIRHFEKPLIWKEYRKIIENNIKGYKKGSLPDWFEIDKDVLKLAIERHFCGKYKCKCELLELINNICF
jgi:hypothetical protein